MGQLFAVATEGAVTLRFPLLDDGHGTTVGNGGAVAAVRVLPGVARERRRWRDDAGAAGVVRFTAWAVRAQGRSAARMTPCT